MKIYVITKRAEKNIWPTCAPYTVSPFFFCRTIAGPFVHPPPTTHKPPSKWVVWLVLQSVFEDSLPARWPTLCGRVEQKSEGHGARDTARTLIYNAWSLNLKTEIFPLTFYIQKLSLIISTVDRTCIPQINISTSTAFFKTHYYLTTARCDKLLFYSQLNGGNSIFLQFNIVIRFERGIQFNLDCKNAQLNYISLCLCDPPKVCKWWHLIAAPTHCSCHCIIIWAHFS